MPAIYKKYNLKKLNAFKVNVIAKFFSRAKSVEDLKELLTRFQGEKLVILGEGYNTLFRQNFDGLVIKIALLGMKKLRETKKHVYLEVNAGENWNKVVNYCVSRGWAGVENLSLIPGSVGAAPIQNIAAYGQNFEDVFYSLAALNIATLKITSFTKQDCCFGYRSSIFKNKHKNKYIIVSVTLKLNKTGDAKTDYYFRYGSLTAELAKFAKPPYGISAVQKAVIRLRKNKFPNSELFGTAGSFFLNPVVHKSKLAKLLKKYPTLQYYPIDKLDYPKPDDPKFRHADHVKVAAGWLLEEIGWAGKRIHDVGTPPHQALVVTNWEQATPKQLLAYTQAMQKDFYENFKIRLEPEVNII